jgi:hypothetical protein
MTQTLPSYQHRHRPTHLGVHRYFPPVFQSTPSVPHPFQAVHSKEALVTAAQAPNPAPCSPAHAHRVTEVVQDAGRSAAGSFQGAKRVERPLPCEQFPNKEPEGGIRVQPDNFTCVIACTESGWPLSTPKTMTDQDSHELNFGLSMSIQPIEVSNHEIEDHE